jgi:hypothetical protein
VRGAGPALVSHRVLLLVRGVEVTTGASKPDAREQPLIPT